MSEPLSPLPENLEKSMASVDQMDARNITEAAVNLDDPPQVCSIETTNVDNISDEMDAI